MKDLDLILFIFKKVAKMELVIFIMLALIRLVTK